VFEDPDEEERMRARVVSMLVQPGKIDEVIAIHRDHVVPALQQQPGFRGTRLLSDASTGKCLIVTLWESEAEMQASEASGWFREQLAKFSSTFAAPPTREHYELSLSF
jgi:heme-degrading monooxygenase HmoA